MDHNDILFAISEPLDVESAVAARVNELRPTWETRAYPNPGYLEVELPNGEQFNCGTLNGEAWACDYYPVGDGCGDSEVECGFSTSIEVDSTDVERIALTLIKGIEQFRSKEQAHDDIRCN